MNKRKLGSSGIETRPLVFGGNVFGWTVDETTSFKILDAFVGAGFDFIDTADIYSAWVPGNKGGDSEIIIGNWIKKTGKRAKITLATKVGMELAPDKKGLSKAYILKAVEDSLTRLQTDYIDLYQSHKDDPHTPLAETLEAFSVLIKQGKVRAIGASNYSAERLAEALKVSRELSLPRFESLQPLYNLVERSEYEGALEALCEKNRIGVISYFSLASGFLTGKYRSEADLSKSARGSRVEKHLNSRGFKVLDVLEQVAKEHGTSPGQVAIAWVIARPSITAPIASARTMDQLEDLLEATELKLTADQMQRLNEVSG